MHLSFGSHSSIAVILRHLLLVLADVVVQHRHQAVEARVGLAVPSALHGLPALRADILPAQATAAPGNGSMCAITGNVRNHRQCAITNMAGMWQGDLYGRVLSAAQSRKLHDTQAMIDRQAAL